MKYIIGIVFMLIFVYIQEIVRRGAEKEIWDRITRKRKVDNF